MDADTLEQLRRLARRWGVSQAEVVRRAVKLASTRDAVEGDSVQERLVKYRNEDRISPQAADEFLEQLSEDRSHWRTDR